MLPTPTESIQGLIAKYRGLTRRELRQYKEENTKIGFVQPLFQALGWDVYNSQEVSAEENPSKSRVDYAFKLRGVSQFYLEAKPLRAELSKAEYIEKSL